MKKPRKTKRLPTLLEAAKAVLEMHCMPTEGGLTYRDRLGAMALLRKAVQREMSK